MKWRLSILFKKKKDFYPICSGWKVYKTLFFTYNKKCEEQNEHCFFGFVFFIHSNFSWIHTVLAFVRLLFLPSQVFSTTPILLVKYLCFRLWYGWHEVNLCFKTYPVRIGFFPFENLSICPFHGSDFISQI